MRRATVFIRDPPAPHLGPVLELMRLIWAVDHALQQASRRMHAATGVTGAQRFVIRIVGRFPGIPAGQLAQLLHLHPSTVTGILKRLERQGFIRRRPDPRDRRRAFLGLTVEGRQIDVAAAGTAEAALEAAIAGMAPQKLQGAGEVLGQLAVSLARGDQDTGHHSDRAARRRRHHHRSKRGLT